MLIPSSHLCLTGLITSAGWADNVTGHTHVCVCVNQEGRNHNCCTETFNAACTDLLICINIHPDAVPPIHAESYHVATDKLPAKDGDKFRSIFSDNLQPIATRGKKARRTLLVDQHCGNGCSIERAPLSVSYYNEISRPYLEGGCTEEVFCRPSTTPVHRPTGDWLWSQTTN